MTKTYIIESFQEFAARHGGKCLKDEQDRFIFPDGAVAIQSYRGDWSLFEPSENAEERLEIAKLYWAARVERSETDFRIMKASLTGYQINGQCTPGQYRWDEREFGPSPSPDGKVALQHLQTIVLQRRDDLKKVEQQIFDLPQNVEKREVEKQVAEEQQRRHVQSSETVYEIEQINI